VIFVPFVVQKHPFCLLYINFFLLFAVEKLLSPNLLTPFPYRHYHHSQPPRKAQMSWYAIQVEKSFFCFVRDSLPANKPAFILCEKALTLICRRLQGCVARIGGRARMGTEKARRNLPAASRVGQPDRIIPTPSKNHYRPKAWPNIE